MATETKAKETKEVKKAEFNPNEWMKERVPYMAFKDDDKYKDDIVVIVNGSNFIIKRGELVHIPRYVLAVLESKDRELRTANKYVEDAKQRAGF
jgi:hypothetical protein